MGIHWQDIQDGMDARFHQHVSDGDDLGPYDFGSIMHDPRAAFSKNGQDSITPIDPDVQIGQRDRYALAVHLDLAARVR